MKIKQRIGPRRPERREEIVGATRKVIERDGFEGASLRAIAREIGCTIGVLTHHFANKQELLRAAVETLFRPFEDALAAALEGEDRREGLRRLFVSCLPVDDSKRRLLRLGMQIALRAGESRSLGGAYRARYAALRAGIEKLLRDGQSAGEFQRDFNPAVEAEILCALFDGLALAALAEPDRFPGRRLHSLAKRQVQRLAAESDGRKPAK